VADAQVAGGEGAVQILRVAESIFIHKAVPDSRKSTVLKHGLGGEGYRYLNKKDLREILHKVLQVDRLIRMV
jgi:hypothetical protein